MSQVNFYSVLELEKTCSQQDIKKGYKRLALEYHPDKNPTGAEKFKLIHEAYQVLADPTTRAQYDRTNKVSGFIAGASSAAEVEKPKGPRVIHFMEFSLEDLYIGMQGRAKVHRKIVCSICKGIGGIAGPGPSPCFNCDGFGNVRRRNSAGVFVRSHVPCIICNGSKDLNCRGRCKTCYGMKTVPETHEVTYLVESGTGQGDTIVLEGAADELPGKRAGDIVIVVQERLHSRFRRCNNNLLTKIGLKFEEFEQGFEKHFHTLDGRKVTINSPPNSVPRHGHFLTVPNEGMPIRGNGDKKGDLIVEFYALPIQPLIWQLSNITLRPTPFMMMIVSPPVPVSMPNVIHRQTYYRQRVLHPRNFSTGSCGGVASSSQDL